MTFPDVTKLVIDHLVPVVAPTKVRSRVPRPRPDRFVQVRRNGGTTETVRDRARLDITTWGENDEDAMALALEVRAAIWATAGHTLDGVPVYRITEFMAPRHADDTDTGTARVWATYELTVRADDAIHRAPTAP